MNSLALSLIGGLYVLFNSGRILSYLPQIYAVAKEKTSVNAISLITWLFWTLANLTTGLYAHIIVKDNLLVFMSYGNTVGCLAVVIIVLFKRSKYKENKVTSLSLGNSFVPEMTDLNLSEENNITSK